MDEHTQMSPDAEVEGLQPSRTPLATTGESATLWRHQNIGGVELFHGNFLDYSFTRHFHSVPAFGALEFGAMRSWHRDSNHTLAPGTVLMFNPGDVHAPFPASDNRWSFRMFYLQDELFEQLSDQSSKDSIRFAAPFASDPALAQKILALHRELEGRCERLEFDCRLLEILEHVTQHYAERRNAASKPAAPQAVARMREYIHAHAEGEVSLETLAGVARLSVYHALRSFRDTLGLPPHKYLLQVRVERAKELLQCGETIADIAARLGFSDQSHLTRQFKRVFGVPPAQSLRKVS